MTSGAVWGIMGCRRKDTLSIEKTKQSVKRRKKDRRLGRPTRKTILRGSQKTESVCECEKTAQYTPFAEKAAEEIRQHMFIKEQPLDYGRSMKPFHPDYAQAQAWQRLTGGRGTNLNIMMLKHEYVELTQMRLHGYVYDEAHEIADRYHNWWEGCFHRT